jgi:protocatechuate 3,4-dioxygenase beta subunit
MEGVSVTLQTRSTGLRLASTNAKGEYKFEGLQPGSYGLLFAHDGFTSVERAVTLTYDDDSGDVDVTLTPKAASRTQPHRRWLARIFGRFASFFRSAKAPQS